MTSGRAPFDRYRAAAARWVDRPVLALPLPIRAHRALFEAQARLNARAPALDVRWETVAGVRCRVATPPRAARRLLYLHGGGFVIGSPGAYAGLTDRLARMAGAEVVAPDYRLAPEHPFPAPVDDCVAVARAMEGPFHLAGDSAGGALALAVLQDLCARGTPPLSVALISPAVDLDAGRPTPEDHDEMLLPERFLRRCVAAYAGGADPADPRLSPIHGRYPGCPPVHVELSAREVLEGDGLAIAERLRAEGAEVAVARTGGVPHVFHLAAGRSPEAERGLRRIARALRAAG